MVLFSSFWLFILFTFSFKAPPPSMVVYVVVWYSAYTGWLVRPPLLVQRRRAAALLRRWRIVRSRGIQWRKPSDLHTVEDPLALYVLAREGFT